MPAPLRSATLEDVKAAYRKRALETLPDHGGDAEEFKDGTVGWFAGILTNVSKVVTKNGKQPWDTHSDNDNGHRRLCADSDRTAHSLVDRSQPAPRDAATRNQTRRCA